MLTRQEMFIDFAGDSTAQLIIPVYQRVYAWTNRQCDQLWADTLRAGRTGSAHFIGTVLYAAEPGNAGFRTRLDVIDGQQRTATFTLLLTALRDYLRDTDGSFDNIDAESITQRYLHIAGTHTAKLVLSRVDRATMSAIVEGTRLPEGDDLSANVVENYTRFRSKMDASFSLDDAETLWYGMQHLLVIAAELDGEDHPQLIFESLNSKGMALTTADLVRNLMLVNVGLDEQTRLYDMYWKPIEKLFGDDSGSTRLNAALHGWLAVTAPQLHIGSADDVYSACKTYMEDVHSGTLEELLIGLKGFCETFAMKSQSASARHADAHTSWANGKVEGIISEKKLFGD